MAVRIVVGNNKGGSGKTCLVTNLAAVLAELGKHVLVVDMDPQANASRRLGARFDPERPTPTTAEVVKDASPGVAAEAIRPCGWDGLYADRVDVIPARFDLENRISEAAVIHSVRRLATALDGADTEHDVTLIDCPPSLGHLTQLAMAAAQWALCAVDPEYDGVDGAIRFRDFITDPRNREHLGNPSLRLLGLVVSRGRSQVGAHGYQIEGLPDTFGADMILEPAIPERAIVKDAADAAVPLRTLGRDARDMADRFTRLAERVLKGTAA